MILQGVVSRDSAIQITPNYGTLSFHSAVDEWPGAPFVRVDVHIRALDAPVQLISVIISQYTSASGIALFSFGTDRPQLPTPLSPSSSLSLGIYFAAANSNGVYQGRLELRFKDPHGARFIVPYILEARSKGEPSSSTSAAAPIYSNGRPPATALQPVPQQAAVPRVPVERRPTRVIHPPELDIFSSIPYLRKLQLYPLDSDFELPRNKEAQIQFAKSRLPESFNVNTYGQFWRALLNMEEAQTIKDLEMYTIYGTHLEKSGKQHYVAVPGLAEKRPSVLLGDVVHASTSSNPNDRYGGRVVLVRDTDIAVRFNKRFKYTAEKLCDLRFTINRITFRRMIQGVLADSTALSKALFPQPSHAAQLRPPTYGEMRGIQTFNTSVASNREQLKAVAAIRLRPAGSPPFVIFGPPGTGKTVTVVESIRQLLHDPNNHILACAPSNAASDTIAERLVELGPAVLFRLNAPSRQPRTLPNGLKPFSFADDREMFSTPSLATMKGYRVVVSTCMSAAVLHGIGVEAGHFTHIFIDEAGQCSEPEMMVGFKTLATPMTNLILSGDPKQLGPIVRSKVAGQLGLSRSFLDRLTELPMYDTIQGSGTTIVKLLKNFRSHESILQFSNEAFYRNELQPSASMNVTDRFLGSRELVSPDFPVVFWGCDGADERDYRSPSYLNKNEISIIGELVDRLVNDPDYPLDANDIGIIAPYRAQVMELKQRLRPTYHEMKIGSTEEFQGQERDVIVVSAVRSDERRIGHDLRHVLGFLANPRRLNVALTRAKALLIVVGNPRILGLDPLWRRFLNFVHTKGGWKGVEPDWDTSAIVEVEGEAPEVSSTAQKEIDGIAQGIQNRLDRLGQWGHPPVVEDDEDDDVNDDVPWQNDE